MTIQSTGGAGTTIWSHETNNEHKIELYFSVKQLLDYDIKWDGNYPAGYFDN